MIASHRLSVLAFLTLLLLLSGCASPTLPTPTMLPAAATPVVAHLANGTPTGTPPTLTPTAAVVAVEAMPVSMVEAAKQAVVTDATRLPASVPSGLRPAEAHLYRQPVIGPDATVEWRPPPMPVPLSLHPDDHYWLIRPLPSDTRNYDLEWFPYGNDVLLPELYPYRVHRGLDFPNPTGTPILAASSGTVIHAGPLLSGLDGVNYYGNTVVIHHDWQWRGQDVYTLYAHTMELFVKEGDYVEQGQLIAGVGRSGIVSGPHLHLEVRIGENSYEHTHNPMLWISPYEGWGTLAGQFIDVDGKYIYGGWVSIAPLDMPGPTRSQYTYMMREVNPDDVWQENFVFGDLPAGRYGVTIQGAGHKYERTVEVLPARTNFLRVQTDFVYAPPTPTPTVAAPAAPISDTLPLEGGN